LDAKVVTSTRRGFADLLEQPSWTPARSPTAVLEDVGGIADQREHAVVADRLSVGRWSLAEHRRLVDLPVAGVEHAAERRLDQQPLPRGWSAKRDEADRERPSSMLRRARRR
jgi:hypothetical protein